MRTSENIDDRRLRNLAQRDATLMKRFVIK